MKRRLIRVLILVTIVVAGMFVMGNESVPVEAKKPEGTSEKVVGDVTAKAGSATLDLVFKAHGGKNVHGSVAYSNSVGGWFDGDVDLCYYQEGDEVAFGGTVIDGSYADAKKYFLIEVQDGESTATFDRVRVRLFTSKPKCKLSGSFPGIVIDGDIKVHLTGYQEKVCTTIKDGIIEYGRVGDPNTEIIPIGYDQWGYNYQSHMFNGMYDNYSRPTVPVTEDDTHLMMKWSDEWLSNKDCNGDGKLDRGYSCDPVNASSSGCYGAWLTNHERGEYDGEWSLVGDWGMDFVWRDNHYVHDMTILDDTFAGTGAAQFSSQTWTSIGEIDGDEVSMTIYYDGSTYEVYVEGLINSDGNMSGDWSTNTGQSGSWSSTDGSAIRPLCNYTYFVKIVTAPDDAHVDGGIWYTGEGVEIGDQIWGAYAITQVVSNDSCAGEHGLQYKSPASPGLGFYTP